MTAYTLAARETVREIRESLSRLEPTVDVLRKEYLHAIDRAYNRHKYHSDQDWEINELWARLAADLAGQIQQRLKEKAL